MLPSTSSAARTALVYITVGALLVIWTGVWFVYLRNSAPENAAPYYWCGGLVITGITLIVIGLGISRSADQPRTLITIRSRSSQQRPSRPPISQRRRCSPMPMCQWSQPRPCR